MPTEEKFYRYLKDGITFVSEKAIPIKMIYFPLCAADERSIKSAVTPSLSGDIKIDKNRYLTKPASREDLRERVRDFFVFVEGKGVFSIAEDTIPESASIEAGVLWHKLVKKYPQAGLEMTALNFVPITGENVELMQIRIRNFSSAELKVIPTFSLPIFGRALANKHDHEQVTSLLHRIEQPPQGVLVSPTMLFDERGHEKNTNVYFVFGIDDKGETPSGTFPMAESFYGEAGTSASPEAVYKNFKPALLPQEKLNGKEAVGALQFKNEVLKPGEAKEYCILMGIGQNRKESQEIFERFNAKEKFDQAWRENKEYWPKKAQSIQFTKSNLEFNSWMRWVSLQPVFRRIFGCSFLPDHDYGKGGKGWRDIWQDLLSLILLEPENVRQALINNFAGVRIDGSNATIIGAKPGEFIADRNNITRVWMDHGIWPWVTTFLYIHQTGDSEILFKKTAYFRDPQLSRTFKKDWAWIPEYGKQLKTKKGKIYEGTILEHILVQHLVQFFNVGEHNLIRLESADWNDGLDMAFDRGESAAFTFFYAGNLAAIADLLENLIGRKKIKKISLAKECLILLDSLTSQKCNYADPKQKRKLLFERYFKAVEPEISAVRIEIRTEDLIKDLRRKAGWIFEHIRRKEKIHLQAGGQKFTWFNGYYDNKGKRVEGKRNDRVWMTLTGQVFAVMSGLAREEEILEIIKSVNHFLKDKTLGGIHLNTDFGVDHYLDLGRAFGFAYGTKENGAFFNHMIVMYAYALYKRGFVREGFEVLNSIYRMSVDAQRSKIYPGLPEYFDREGRGMYPYLTGSASWLILTELTEVFGVRGSYGDLILSPKLVREEFNAQGLASVDCQFAGRRLNVCYTNPQKLDFGKYAIRKVLLNNETIDFKRVSSCVIKIERKTIQKIPLFVKLDLLLES